MGLLLPDYRWFNTIDILADNCEKEPWVILFYFCGTPQSQIHRTHQVITLLFLSKSIPFSLKLLTYIKIKEPEYF
jgi:hypothetical protein